MYPPLAGQQPALEYLRAHCNIAIPPVKQLPRWKKLFRSFAHPLHAPDLRSFVIERHAVF